jgi:MFS family permease
VNGRTRRIFLGGQITSLFGDGLALLALPLLVLQLTRNPLLAGLASAVRAVGYLLVGLPAGPIVDRLDSRSVLIGVDVIRAALFLALAILAGFRACPVTLALGLAFGAACAAVFFDAALAVTVQDLFPGEHVLPANAALETASQLARVLGPAAAGVLIAAVGVDAVLLLNAGTFVVALLTVTIVKRQAGSVPAELRAGPVTQGLVREFVAGIRYLRMQHPTIDLTIVMAAVNLCLAADTLIIFFAKIGLGLTPVLISAVIAAGGCGGVLGALAAPRLDRRFRRLSLMSVSVLIAALAVATMAVASAWWELATANAVMIFCTALAGLLFRSLRQELIPRAMLGRVTVTVRTVFLAATPLGTLIAGSVAAAAGDNPRPVFAGAGLLLVFVIATAWYMCLRTAEVSASQ